MAKGSLRVNGIIVDADGEIKASTGDAIVVREDDGSAVITVDTGGRALIGSSFTADAIAGVTAGLQIEGIADASSSVSLFRNSNSLSPPYLILGKSRGGAVGADTIVQDNDEVGTIVFVAADGVDRVSRVAEIRAMIGGTPGANDTPGELLFLTTADGAQISTERMRIMADGKVGIGTTAPASHLDVRGTVQVGVDDVGHDVVFYGASASSNFHWDQAADTLSLNDTKLHINQDDNEKALLIDSESTSEVAIAVTAKYGVSIIQDVSNGYAANFSRNIAETGSSPLVNFIDDHASNTQTTFRIQQDGSGDIVNFFDGGTERFTILDGGNVGINTVAPASALHVAGSVQVGVDDLGFDVIFYGNTASSNFAWNAGNDWLTMNDARLIVDQDDDELGITIDSEATTSGKYGLGINAKFGLYVDQDVSGGYAAYFRRAIAEAGSNPLVSIVDDHSSNSQTALRIQQDGTGDIVNFFDGGTEVFTVLNGGNVGINQTAPASALHVTGTMQVGVDDTGHDVKFFGARTLTFMEWDESAWELEIRGGTEDGPLASTAGKLLLSTSEPSVVDGNLLGRIDFQAAADGGGTDDSVKVGASIWAEADATFSATVNDTDLVFATGLSEVATEKMRLTSDGKIGMGVTAPVATIDIHDVSTNGIVEAIKIYGQTGQDDGVKLTWASGSGQAHIRTLRGSLGGSVYQTPLVFSVNHTSGGNKDAMFISGLGNVGINTLLPINQLDVSQSAASAEIAAYSWSTTATNAGTLLLGHSNHATLANYTAIDADDQLGGIHFVGANGSAFVAGALIQAFATETFSGTARGTEMRFSTTDATTAVNDVRMTIDHDGKVGIGYGLGTNVFEQSVGKGLVIYNPDNSSTNNSVNLVLAAANASTQAVISFNDSVSDNSSNGSILYDLNAEDMYFKVGGSNATKMFLMGNGRLGIGTTSPDGLIHVYTGDSSGTASANADELIVESSSHGGISIFTGNSAVGNLYFGSSAAVNSGFVSYEHASNLMKFGTSATAQMHILSSGFVGIGSATPQNRLEVVESHASNVPVRMRETNTSHTGQVLHLINDSTHSYAGVLKCYGSGRDRPLVNIDYVPNDTNRTSAGNYGLLAIGHKSASDTTAIAQSITRGDGATTVYHIDFSGSAYFANKVGIGTATPDDLLHVFSGSAGSVTADASCDELVVEASGDGGISILTPDGSNADIHFGSPSIAGSAIIRNNMTADLFKIGTNNAGASLTFHTAAFTERLRIDANGHTYPGVDNTQNLGTGSRRWANLYVGDMQLSNEGSGGNEVDGTEGSWTIQEGDENLFLINRTTGKQFKLRLEEV